MTFVKGGRMGERDRGTMREKRLKKEQTREKTYIIVLLRGCLSV
jgi:hypothetical protein